ncbi:MAG TPA: T9SS type A sorting domain-containing protein, partial [Bacteroidia bacterium]|nr:T9SS type A sorting domain-containing protein [Bacteroidia bacterium]
DLQLLSVQAYSVNQIYLSQNSGVYLQYKVKAWVRNAGSIPVSSFFLNARLNDDLGHCTKNILQECVQGIMLQPGDSILVQPDTLITDFTQNWNSSMCFLDRIVSLSVPNGEMDALSTNDTKTLSITHPMQYTGLNTQSAARDWVVYPNPAKNYIVYNYSGEYDILKFKIIDIEGRVVYQEHRVNCGQAVFEFELNSGIYFVEATDDYGTKSVKKLIVSH